MTTVKTAKKSAPGSMSPRRRWMLLSTAGLVVLMVAVVGAHLFRASATGQSFIDQFPGHNPVSENSAPGFPAWLAWQHFLNAFFLLLIIRSGWQVRHETRPHAYWSPRRGTKEGNSNRISVTLWFHLAVDLLWLANGVLFALLLLVTGRWERVVPSSWEIVPNAISAGIQYLSLDWPHENGWMNYNSLQVIAYFATIFLAAPLAALTGARMSPLWPSRAHRLNGLFPIEVARAVHFPVMLYFVLFVIAHVTLVATTGVLRNLNHMFAGRDDHNWIGFIIFGVSTLVMAAAVIAARPVVIRTLAALFGKVSR